MKLIEETIVAYLDILGYSSLIKNDDQTQFEIIKKVVREIFEKIKKRKKSISSIFKITGLHNITFKMISDTIIFTLVLPSGIEKNRKKEYIKAFFESISIFSILFISKTGYLFRGGISFGTHYEYKNEKKNLLLIFSKAYVNAYELEQNAKRKRIPRVLVGKELIDFLKQISFDTEDFFDNEFFNLYAFFKPLFIKSSSEENGRALGNLLNGLKTKIENNLGNYSNGGNNESAKILRYLKSFVKFHNSKLKTFERRFPRLNKPPSNLNLNDFKINS